MWEASAFDHPMNSDESGGFQQGSGSGGSSQNPQTDRVRKIQNVIPLVVRQILGSDDDDFTIFNSTVHMITLVGIVRTIDVNSTKITCEVEDYTGSIKVATWLTNDDENKPKDVLGDVKIGRYYRVTGSIRTQQGEKIVVALRMDPVDSLNVITTHLLEVIHVRLALEADPDQGEQPSVNAPGATLVTSMSSMMEVDSFMDQHGSNVKDQQVTGLTVNQDKVYKVLLTDQSIDGLHFNTVLRKCAPMQKRDVDEALNMLMNEGHAYTTIDDQHFKGTAY